MWPLGLITLLPSFQGHSSCVQLSLPRMVFLRRQLLSWDGHQERSSSLKCLELEVFEFSFAGLASAQDPTAEHSYLGHLASEGYSTHA